MVYNLKLSNSILGWMLNPSYLRPTAGVEELLSLLYADDWLKMKSSDRAFMKDEPVEKVIDHLKKVFQSLNLSASICGNRKLPTIRVWFNKVTVIEREKVSVDLKWCCWSKHNSTWDEYAPGVWEKAEAAFKGEAGPVTVNTAPRKEIRYGSVTIYKGGAAGHFCCEWDSVEDLADTLGTTADDGFHEMIPCSVHLMEPGMDWDFKVKARTFASLMRKIDNEEDSLLQAATQEWGYIEACFRPV
jgi:hypothetical protein